MFILSFCFIDKDDRCGYIALRIAFADTVDINNDVNFPRVKMMKNKQFWIASITFLLLIVGCGKKDGQPIDIKQAASAYPSSEEVKAIAQEAYIYGLPIVMNYVVMNEYVLDKNSGQYKAPFNTIHNENRVFTYKDTSIVTPNSDTPYSMVWLDLRAEPMVVSVPAVPKNRYYSVQFIDGNTYNYGYIGSRTTGFEAGNYLIVGPGWTGDTPAGIQKVFQSSTPFGLTIFRTQLFNPDDMKNVEKIQAGYKAQPLSTFLKKAPAAEPEKAVFPSATTEGIKSNFYEYLDAALQFVPAGQEDQDIRNKLSKIGIGANKTYAYKDMPSDLKAAADQGMKEGDEKIAQFLVEGIKNINGWNVGSVFGDRTFFNGNWLLRAAAAKAGIYGNDATEAMYPASRFSSTGEKLDTSANKYTITFAKGQLPPVNAFWSVTMYDGKTQLLIENPIERYLINSPMLSKMRKNQDGSLTIYVQKDSPGKAKESNWLPAPNGNPYLVMRLYWPKVEAPSILPPGSGSWSPPGIELSK